MQYLRGFNEASIKGLLDQPTPGDFIRIIVAETLGCKVREILDRR
jgi:hypothetical protein